MPVTITPLPTVNIQAQNDLEAEPDTIMDLMIQGPEGDAANVGGAATQVQFNTANALDGDAQFTWDKIEKRLGLGAQGSRQLSLTKSIGLAPTTADDVGVIYKGAQRFLHDFVPAGANGGNVFVGDRAGNFTMALGGSGANRCSRNTAIGKDAMLGATKAYDNTAVGNSALVAVTEGSGNVAIGVNAGLAITTAFDNLCLGTGSLRTLISGAGNVAVGANALALCTGSSNVAVGSSTLANAAGTSGNVGVGGSALLDVTSGSNNIAVGPSAGRGITTGSNNVIIGPITGLPSGLANNIILADGAGNRRMTIDANGSIGLGTADQFGSGARVIGLANATAVPSTNPTGGGVIYVEAGALKYRGSAGTVTVLGNA